MKLRRSLAITLALTVPLALGCEEEKKKPEGDESSAVDAGPKKPILDKKLNAAMAAAASATAPVKQQDGPPERGVFAPGQADKQLPPGTDAKIEVYQQGAEPRFLLKYAPLAEQKSTVTVDFRMAQSALPTLAYSLAIKLDKPKEGDKDKKTDGPFLVVAKLVKVEAVGMALPKDAADDLAKIKGMEIKYELSQAGVVKGLTTTLPKGADAEKLEGAIQSLASAIQLLTIPLPDKPVGKGDYWLVTDRAKASNVDVLRYRVFRVESIDKDKAAIAVEIRNYATKEEADLGSGGKEAKLALELFESQGKGRVEWMATSLLPSQGNESYRVQARLVPPGGGQQRMLMQSEIAAKVAPQTDDKDKDKDKEKKK